MNVTKLEKRAASALVWITEHYYTYWRCCGRKRTFLTRGDGIRFIKQRQFGVPVSPYLCPYCNEWHIGNSFEAVLHCKHIYHFGVKYKFYQMFPSKMDAQNMKEKLRVDEGIGSIVKHFPTKSLMNVWILYTRCWS